MGVWGRPLSNIFRQLSKAERTTCGSTVDDRLLPEGDFSAKVHLPRRGAPL
jgi:hypothetical protein